MASVEEAPMDFYGNNDAFDDENNSGGYGGGSDDDCFLDEEAIGGQNSSSRKNCTCLLESDIRKRMEEAIAEVSDVLSVSKEEASILLRYCNWSVSKVNDAWFADESEIRQKVGLLCEPVCQVPRGSITCKICFESHRRDKFLSASCGHPYCRTCWKGYIRSSINNDGLGCLKLRCPEPSCNAAVDEKLIEAVVSARRREKYAHFLIRSFVEENKKTKWCPSPGCEYAIEFLGGDGSCDVTCHCFNSFCWNCEEESHRPVDCATVKEWNAKKESESLNVNYILAYCKSCPNCKRPIEKNAGCMHMTCKLCSHEFCWICLRPYRGHTGCNSYKQSRKLDERKQKAKQSLEKYTHYFERWVANQKSKLKALSDLKQVQTVQFKKLSKVQGIPETQLEFITKAWLQIVECRRVLEWSYAYGYYMPDNEDAKKKFFEYLQGEAESTLEKLHNLVEGETSRFLVAAESWTGFCHFRSNVLKLTAVTGNYFNKLVKALENGLSDVLVVSSTNVAEDYWYCDRCTYRNHGSATICEVCDSVQDDDFLHL